MIWGKSKPVKMLLETLSNILSLTAYGSLSGTENFSAGTDRVRLMYAIKKDGVLKMSTEHIECLYDKNIRAQMRKAGYKIYKDGKIFKEE